MKQVNTFINKYGHFLHPVLFALFPLLSFYGANASEINAGNFKISTFVFFNLIVLAICWATSLLLTWNLKKSSLLTLAFIAVFFNFGRAHRLIDDVSIKLPFTVLGPSKILAILSVVFIVVAWIVIKKKVDDKTATKLNSTFSTVGLVMILITLVSIVPASLGSSKSTANSDKKTPQSTQKTKNEMPDIYYVLLDGYGRADYLKSNFGFDNSAFINSLKQKNFYVAEQANSNYLHTHFSAPSTLNMKYLNYLTKQMGEESVDRKPLSDLMDDSRVVSDFQALGYSYVNIGSQWGWSENSPQSDIEVEAKTNVESKVLGIKLDEFALVYMQTTALKPLISSNIRDELVAKTLGAFERTKHVPEFKEPTLTFTHVVSPHPPYLFNSQGVIPSKTRLELDNHGFSDKKSYIEQTKYVNELTTDLIDTILKNSDKPPIIIVASDHGPASDFTTSDFSETNPKKFDIPGIRERAGIINAYYFPDQNYTNLYPTISPVNSFRILFKQYFDRDIELLPDKTYFSNNKANEYRMFDVTQLVN